MNFIATHLEMILITCGILFGIAIPCAIVYYVAHKFREDFPEKKLINALRAEVAEFSGQTADLNERFSLFQKRQGMRAAREEKEVQRSLRDQANDIMGQGGAQGAVPQDPGEVKRQLRLKLQGMNS